VCLRLNHIYTSTVRSFLNNESGKVIALTGWDAEELLEELVGGVDDDG
jgi:hypothetical protein